MLNKSKPSRFERIKHLLACPKCHTGLVFEDECAVCVGCKLTYPIRNEKIYFTHIDESMDDAFDRVKYRMKKVFGNLYYKIGVGIVAPTFPFNYLREIKKHVHPEDKVVVDIGCGAYRMDSDLICIDIFDYESVDIVCDIMELPFKDGTVDAFVSRSVLEHVRDPKSIINEVKRCTRSGGISAHLIPFMMPFHASPYDFQRYTHKGALELFSGWECVEQFAPFGPFTLLLQSFIEVVSSILSFGNEQFKTYLYLGLCLILFPVKFLDWPFVRRKCLIGIAPSIFTVVRKTI